MTDGARVQMEAPCTEFVLEAPRLAFGRQETLHGSEDKVGKRRDRSVRHASYYDEGARQGGKDRVIPHFNSHSR